jgi:hypothetical protein
VYKVGKVYLQPGDEINHAFEDGFCDKCDKDTRTFITRDNVGGAEVDALYECNNNTGMVTGIVGLLCPDCAENLRKKYGEVESK